MPLDVPPHAGIFPGLRLSLNIKKDIDVPNRLNTWGKRIAVGSFFFFLAKGLVWIGIAVVAIVAST